MGLMDFLGLDTRDIQEFTRGFVGSKVEAMEAEANRKAGLKNEEDKLKLANKYSAQAYKDQLQIEADNKVQLETVDRNNLKTELLGLDMSVDFYNLIPSIYTANFNTYKGYVDSQHDGNFDWWRMPVQMPDGSMGTRESYTLAANQNFLNKKNLSSNLTSNDGALANQSNSADLLLEDKETTPQFADFSEFIAKPEQVKAQVDAMETDSDIQMQGDQSVQIPAFQGLGLDTDFDVSFEPRKDVDKERTSNNMIDSVVQGGGFGDNVIFDDDKFVGFKMEGDITERKRFNATTSIGQAFIEATYQATGVAPTGLAAAQEALKQVSQIQLIASIHTSNQLDSNEYPELARAVELGVINQQQALEGQRYFDFLKFDELGYGFEVKTYYRALVGDKFMPVAQKPAWLDTFSENLDEAVLGSMDVSEEEQFNAEGDVIVKEEPKTETAPVEEGSEDKYEALKKKKARGGLTDEEEEEFQQLKQIYDPEETAEDPNKAQLEAELATLRKSKKTKQVKDRIKEIETILENLEE